MPISDLARQEIFDKLRQILLKSSPPLVVNTDIPYQNFELIGNKPVPYGSKKVMVPGMFFACILPRKDSITFHFFPNYMNPHMQAAAPNLYKYLKGKTCFHFKSSDQVLEEELINLVKEGLKAWEKLGYMK